MDEPIDPWLSLAASAAGGAAMALWPWPSLAAVVAIMLLVRRRGAGLALLAACSLLMALSVWRSARALELAADRYDVALAALPAPRLCWIDAEVVRSPMGERVDVAVVAARCDEDRGSAVALPRGMIVRLHGAPSWLGRGDRIEALSTVAPLRLFNNPAATDPRVRLSLTGVVASGGANDVVLAHRPMSLSNLVDRARAHVRRRIMATYPAHTEAFARALVLGETELGDVDRDAFRVSGLSHLLAVSGTHLIIAVVALARALRSLLTRVAFLAERMDVGRIAALIAAPLAWLYADFAGGGGSADRAAAMLGCAMLARAAARQPSAVRCFAWSILFAVGSHPLAVGDLSFTLSLTATAGLLWGALPWVRAGRSRWWQLTVGAAWATTAAMLACAPVVLSIGSELPLLGVAANLLAAPVGELAALPLALLHAASWWSPAAEQGLALLATASLSLVRAIAHAACDVPWAGLRLPPPTVWQLATLAVAVVGWHIVPRRWCLTAALMALSLGEIAARRDGAPTGVLRVTVLDVGQGDAILIDLPDGKLMLVDAGGLVGSPMDVAERALLPQLRARRRVRVDVAVLSHPHPDHYGGLLSPHSDVAIGELWSSGLAIDVGGQLGQALSALAPVRLARDLCGRQHRFGQARVDVLAPCPGYDRARSANDNSLVLRLRVGHRVVLLAGDAERAQEQLLLRGGRDLRADLLKVGHHGSRTSSGPAFIAAVRPSLAVISCGSRNRFGHPHRVTLDTLVGHGSTVVRTDRGGALVWQTDGERVRWRRPGRSWIEARRAGDAD